MDQTLTAARVDWPTVQFIVAAAMTCERDMEKLRARVESGDAVAYVLTSVDGVPMAAFVARVDESGFLDVMAAAGMPGLDLIGRVLPEIEAVAKARGMPGVMVDTWRRGMVEKLGRAGYGTAYVKMVREF